MGPAANVTGLVRAGVSASLVNLTLDAPALPATSVADYGVVNHNESKSAYLGPVDLDPLVNETVDTLEAQLAEAGYTGTELDNTTDDLRDLFDTVVDEQQDVTVNVTHYRYNDLFHRDYLYSTFDALLENADEDQNLVEPVNGSLETVRDRLSPWQLEPYHLVPEQSGTVHTPVNVNRTCPYTPVLATLSLADTAINLITSEAKRMDGTSKAPRAQAIVGELPSEASAFFSDDNQAFVVDQGRQLACLEDQKELLSFLEERAEAMRELSSLPYGAWNHTEAQTGDWNNTPLGHQVENTTDNLDVRAEHLAENSTLVLDVTVDALNRSLSLANDKLDALETPRIKAHEPVADDENVLAPPTDRNATREAPLGGYTGLATVTSHDVEVVNPLNGTLDPDLRRNVTVPVPSFLFNNPTLEWQETFRDGEPLDTRVKLKESGGGAPLNVSNNWTTVDDVTDLNVSLAANATHRYADLANATQALNDTLTNLTGNETHLAPIAPFNQTLGDAWNETQTHLEELEEHVSCASAGYACDKVNESRDWLAKQAANALYGQTWSRHRTHENVTGENGQAQFRNVFPGSYELVTPYPYPIVANLTQNLPYTAPGQGWFEGPLEDITLDVHRQVHDQSVGWPEHSTAHEAPPGDPGPPDLVDTHNLTHADIVPYTEIHGEPIGTVHPFQYTFEGVDLLGMACLDLDEFANKTDTRLRLPGCQDPSLTPPQRDAVERVVDTARCALENDPASLDEPTAWACTELAAWLEDCQANTTCPDAAATELESALEAARDHGLELLDASGSTALLPHARSPARVLDNATHREDMGVTCERHEDATKALNPGVEREDWCDPIDRQLRNLTELAKDTVNVTTPDRVDTYNHTTGQGILHHTTDRVSGLDWVHIGTDTAEPLDDENSETKQKIVKLLQDAENRIAGGDAKLIGNYRAEVDDNLAPSQTVGAFDEGLVKNASQTAEAMEEGWRANGTTSLDPYDLDGTVDRNVTRNATETCQTVEVETNLPEAYVDCTNMQNEVGPSPEELASVDTVTLANQILEQARRNETVLDDRNASLSDERVQEILTSSVAKAASPPSNTVHRTEDGIRIEQDVNETAPMLGALYYTTPLPVNEHVNLRMNGELLLDDTAALVVHTANPLVTQAVLAATDELPEALNDTAHGGLGGVTDTVSLLQENVALALDEAEEEDPLTRAELFGFPLTAEQQANAGPVADADTRIGSEEPCGTVTPDGGTAASDLCQRGFAATRPDGYYNLTRTYEFNTKGRDTGDGHGPSLLHTLVVYFPSVTDEDGDAAPRLDDADPDIGQKMVLRNLSLQLKTYIGLQTENNPTALEDADEHATHADTLRSGYRANVEDFKQLWALPGQPLDGDAEGLEGVRASFQGDNATLNVTEDRLLQGLGLFGSGYCPKTAAPGHETVREDGTLMQSQKGIASMADDDRGLSWAETQTCLENTIEGAEPRHVEAPLAFRDVWMSNPSKSIVDALPYQFRVVDTETFTRVGPDHQTPPVLHLLNDVLSAAGETTHQATGLATSRGLDEAETASKLVAGELAHWPTTAASTVQQVAGTPLFDVKDALPLVQQSWLSRGQPQFPATVGEKALHNYAVFDQDDARVLVQDPWDPSEPITREDTAPTTNRTQHDPDPVAVHGQRLPDRETNDHHAGVVAQAFESHVTQDPNPNEQDPSTAQFLGEKVAHLLVGNGRTGTGTAVTLNATYLGLASDQDRSSFLDGQTANLTASVEVTVYNLGGERTAGSDCADLPILEYVDAYWRCRGYTQASNVTLRADATAGHGCYGAALATLAEAHDRALNTTTGMFEGPAEPVAQRALSYLATTENPIENPPSSTYVNRTLDAVDTAHSRARSALSLIDCIDRDAGVEVTAGWSDVPDLALVEENLTRLLDQGIAGRVGTPVLNVSAELAPNLHEAGEPGFHVEPRVELNTTVREHEALAEVNHTPVNVSVEEWTSALAHGWVNVTEGDNGANTSTNLELEAGDVDGSWEGEIDLDLDQGVTYEVNFTVLDEYGDRFNDTVVLTSDVVDPDQNAVPFPELEWTNATHLDVNWSARDNTTGLEKVVLERRAPNTGDWTLTNVTETNLAGTPNATVNGTLDLSEVPDDPSENQDVVLRFLAEDRAGNRDVVQRSLQVDRLPPQVTVDLTEDDIANFIPITGDVAFEDTGSLTEATAWFENVTAAGNLTHTVLDETGEDIPQDTTEVAYDAWTNHTYRLWASAEDQAGNDARSLGGTVDVQLVPNLTAQVPDGGSRPDLLRGDVNLTGNVTFDEYPNLTVDEASLELAENGSTTLAWNHTEANVDDTVADVLDHGEANDGAGLEAGNYTLNITAQHGNLTVWTDPGVDVEWQPPVEYANLTSWREAFGYLNGSEENLYLYDYVGDDCRTWDEFQVRAESSHNEFDLYLDDEHPKDAGRNGSTYKHSREGYTSHGISVEDPGADEYAVLIEPHADTTLDYEVWVEAGCEEDTDDGSDDVFQEWAVE